MEAITAKFDMRAVSCEAEWKAALGIRKVVFIEEQDCPPDEEWDEYDDTSRHLLGWVGDEPVAVSRWRVVPFEGRLVAKLERFAVLMSFRGRGLGRKMVEATIDDAVAAGFEEHLIHAQAHLEKYYSGLGFERIGEAFVEAGIQHVMMVRSGPRT